MQRHLIGFTIALAIASVPRPAFAKNYLHTLATRCTNGTEIAQLSKRKNEAAAMADDGQYSLASQLALAEYHCAVGANDPYLRDLASLWSAEDLFESAAHPADQIRLYPTVNARLFSIESFSHFPELQKIARLFDRNDTALYNQAITITTLDSR